jgi:hypothetical protein
MTRKAEENDLPRFDFLTAPSQDFSHMVEHVADVEAHTAANLRRVELALKEGQFGRLEHISLRLNRRDSQWFVNERVYPP